jgi:hypothetical protein
MRYARGMAEPAHPLDETAAILRLSGRLTRALREVIDSSPFAGLGPIEVARILGVDKTLVSRLMSALRANDSLPAISALPGVVPLRQFLVAAREHGARARAVQSAERELRAFEHELLRAFGTRTRLDAVIADALPEARQRHEETARQAVYRGMALIKGVSIDLESFTWIIHPGRKDRVDVLFVGAFVGIQRLRPTARFRFAAHHEHSRPKTGVRLLTRFCRPAHLSVSTTSREGFIYYEIATGSVRRDGAADIYLTEHLEGAARRVSTGRKEVWTVGDILEQPVKRLELNVLLHEDVWPGCDFSARAYHAVMRGPVTLPDPEREFDRLALQAEVTRSSVNADALRSSPVPNFAAVLRHVMAPLGWSWNRPDGTPAFRSFRCEVAYPLYGAQIILVRE